MRRPRSLVAITTGALLFTTALLAVDRVITGIVQCSALGCLPA